ncbi:Zinc finger, CCCH-type [Sesbania bispinosa]|nr:Zinc finger, CCCH-type [Sesbania bispinosa]
MEMKNLGVASISSSKSSYLERSGKLKPRMGFSSKEPFPGGRGSNNDDVTNKDYSVLDATVAWKTDGSCSMTMSPGFEEWKNKKLGQSLKDSCNRSVRSSRSRSPPHGFMWDSGVIDKNRASAGRLTQPCRDFAAGKCRRGSHCHFLHLGNQNFEDSWESRHRQDGAPRYSAAHESGDYCLTSGRSDEACINFLKGRCRMGASCKYVHHDNSDGFGKVSADESSRDRVINRRHMENSFEQGGWRYPNHIGTPCKFFAFGNCRNGKHCRFSHDRQACRSPNRRLSDDRTRINQGGDQVLDRPKLSDSDTPNRRIRDDRWCSDGSIAAVDKVWDGPNKNHLVAVFDTAKLVEDNKNGVMSFTAWPMSDGWGHNLDKNRVHGESPFSSYKKEANCWTAENAIDNIRISQSVDRSIWPGDEKMSPDWNYGERSSSRIKEEHRQNKQQVSPGQGYNHAARNVNALHSSSYHGVVQSHVLHSIALPRLRTEGMQNQEVSTEKRYTVESIASLSQVGSRNHPTHNMVSKEQLAQLTCLSASLAHFLGAGRQLLQLNTSSSSHDTKGVPSVDQTEGSGDPMSDSMETSGVPQTFSPIENVPNDAVEIPSLLSNSGQNFDDFCKTAFSSELVKSENEMTAEENDPLEDMDKSGGSDEANKIKDVKGIRAFKFSLVEYIKELLKPTWKEGQITKEDYKAIVKKVTDKVTGSVQREHIPQTQDKIDHYLSFSKPKLNKLVQAYVEKVRKA